MANYKSANCTYSDIDSPAFRIPCERQTNRMNGRMIHGLISGLCDDGGSHYQRKSRQKAQNVGCRKNLATNLWPLTSWTLWCLMAPRRRVIPPPPRLKSSPSSAGAAIRQKPKLAERTEKIVKHSGGIQKCLCT
jgi:hypothetical protein